MLEKFSGLIPKGPYLSLEKEKETFCVVFTYSVKLVHVAVVQQQLKNVRKRVMYVQSCCFAKINLLHSCRSLCLRRHCCLSSFFLWSKNFATMETWRHTSPLYWTQASMLFNLKNEWRTWAWNIERLILCQTWLASLRVDSTELVDRVTHAC